MSGRIKAARAGYSGDANYRRSMPGTGYAGDPGLFGFVGKLIKGGVGAAAALATGGGVSGAVGAFRRSLASGRGVSRRQQRAIQQRLQGRVPMQEQRAYSPGGGLPIRPSLGDVVIQQPFGGINVPQKGSRGAPIAGRGTAIMAGAGGSCPTGYKPNKTGYWITSPQGTPSYVSPGERCVKIRKRNPLNPRAWDRAYGRLKSSKRWQKKIAAVTFREKC